MRLVQSIIVVAALLILFVPYSGIAGEGSYDESEFEEGECDFSPTDQIYEDGAKWCFNGIKHVCMNGKISSKPDPMCPADGEI